MNLFDALLHTDQEEDPDRAVVIHAANLLEVGEFQLLQLAFFEWYGREMHCSEKDPFFRSVFLEKKTPGFLRHYARKIVLSGDSDDLEAGAPFYHRYDPVIFDRRLPNGIGRFVGVARELDYGYLYCREGRALDYSSSTLSDCTGSWGSFRRGQQSALACGVR